MPMIPKISAPAAGFREKYIQYFRYYRIVKNQIVNIMRKNDFDMLNPYDPERKSFIFWKYFLFIWDSEIELIQFFKNPEIEGGDLEGRGRLTVLSPD